MFNLLIFVWYLLGTIVPLSGSYVPYFDTEGIFHMNYTGECINGIPNIAFVCEQDSLDTNSLLTIYPTLVFMDQETFDLFIASKE